MLRRLSVFRASVAEGARRNVSTQSDLDLTSSIILWSQTENIFGLIEGCAENFLNQNFSEEENFKFLEERLNFFYQLLGTVIVEKNTDQFQRKIEVDLKLAECRYKLERGRKYEFKKMGKKLDVQLNEILTVLQNIQKSNVEINQENAEAIHNIRKILVALAPRSKTPDVLSNHNERKASFTFTKLEESNIVHKLKTLQSFWTTICNNLQSSLNNETKETARHILQSINDDIIVKLEELHIETETDAPISLVSFTSDESSTDLVDDNEKSPFKDPEKMHTFETLQIARRTVNLKKKISNLLEELYNNYEDSKYDKLKKILDKCQDGFEEIECHYNPDLVALRTETFDVLLKASKIMNEKYEQRLFKKTKE